MRIYFAAPLLVRMWRLNGARSYFLFFAHFRRKFYSLEKLICDVIVIHDVNKVGPLGTSKNNYFNYDNFKNQNEASPFSMK